MGLYKAISVAALGIASYALYKTGALNPAIKKAVKVGSKASDFADETVAKAKEGYKNLRTKVEEIKNSTDETNEPVTGELITEE